jgi:hypothetical protein
MYNSFLILLSYSLLTQGLTIILQKSKINVIISHLFTFV